MPMMTAPAAVWSGLRRLLLLLVLYLLGSLPFGFEPLAQQSRTGDVGRRPPGFSDTYPYTDGIEAQINDVWTGRRLGMPVVELTITLRNDSAHTFEARFTGDLRYGPYRLPALRYLVPPGPDDSGSVQLIAIGESSDPYRLTFMVPPHSQGDLMFVLDIDAGAHDPAVFVGGL